MTQQTNTTEMISARATGVLFFSAFGSLWLYNGLAASHRLNPITVAAILVILTALVVPAIRLIQTASKAAPPQPDFVNDTPEAIQRKRAFHRVNAIQWIAIVAAVVFFNFIHRPEFLAPVIAFIVGMHLFPLAKLFRYGAHNVTGTLLVLWSTAIVTVLPAQALPSAGALGAATILLVSAAYTLATAYRQSEPSPKSIVHDPTAFSAHPQTR
jgi:energy-coupling factor transporter transmembrane protein EcfT